MERYVRLLAIWVMASVMSGCAYMDSAPAKISEGVLKDNFDMTLYVFDKDTANSGRSACNGVCATNWPPLMAEEGAKPMGDYSIVKRDDGKMQWAYKGKPLYLWVKDKKPGDKTGDGANGMWHIAKP